MNSEPSEKTKSANAGNDAPLRAPHPPSPKIAAAQRPASALVRLRAFGAPIAAAGAAGGLCHSLPPSIGCRHRLWPRGVRERRRTMPRAVWLRRARKLATRSACGVALQSRAASGPPLRQPMSAPASLLPPCRFALRATRGSASGLRRSPPRRLGGNIHAAAIAPRAIRLLVAAGGRIERKSGLHHAAGGRIERRTAKMKMPRLTAHSHGKARPCRRTNRA